MPDIMETLRFDVIIRGWCLYGDQWKLVEIDLTKCVEINGHDLVITNLPDKICIEAVKQGGGHCLWTKDDFRDRAMLTGDFG